MILQVLAVIATIVVILFSSLLLLGFWAMRNSSPSPSLPGYGPEDADDLVSITSDFEMPTLSHFLQSAVSGQLPSGARSSLPPFPAAEMEHLAQPYASWAPKPHSELPAMASLLGTMPGPSPSAIIRVGTVMSGTDGLLNGVKLQKVERGLRAVKSKVWFGMAPVTDASWRMRDLDGEGNIEEALATIRQVLRVFEHLLQPDVQGALRDGYNRIWCEWDIFQDAVNATYEARGESKPEWSLSKLWQEYMENHFVFMERQARAWTFKHLLTLHTIWKTRFLTVMQSGRSINETQTTVRIDHFAMLILNSLQDLYLEADIRMRVVTAGFSFAKGIDKRFIGAITLEKSPQQLNATFAAVEAMREKNMRKAVEVAVREGDRKYREGGGSTVAFMKEPMRVTHREFAHKSLQPEIEAPFPLEMETWVRELGQGGEKFGFMAYRVSYGESDETWAAFLAKVQESVESGWEGVIGAGAIKGNATLEWVDGHAQGIAEGDVEEVWRHFTAHNPSSPTISNRICIVATPDAVSSFLATLPSDSVGYSHPYLVAISTVSAHDSDTEPTNTTSSDTDPTNATPPAELTTFKIPAHHLYRDLYALTVHHPVLSATEFAALAAQHPLGLYDGPSTGERRREWRKLREGAGEDQDDKSK